MRAKRLGVIVAAGLFCATAMATNINISVQQPNGTNAITVHPGDTVNYKIVGELSNDPNEGLALIGLSLDFDLADLTPADAPSTNPMLNFVIPAGITNPAGFGGTVIGGNLIQIGGAQNTIKNTIGNAPFPIGTVIMGVAKFGTPVTIATGSLTIPLGTADGPHHLNASDVFANVIKAGEVGDNPFLATEAAGVGTVTNLTFTVSGVVPATLTAANPPTGRSLPRTQKNTARLTFSAAVAAPVAGDIQIQELLDGGAFGPNLAGTFTFTIEPGNVLKMRDNANTLQHRHWYAFRNVGDWDGVANFEVQYVCQVGDANNDGRTLFTDLGFINARIPTDPAADDERRDINGDGRVLFTDMGAANARIPSDLVPKPTGH